MIVILGTAAGSSSDDGINTHSDIEYIYVYNIYYVSLIFTSAMSLSELSIGFGLFESGRVRAGSIVGFQSNRTLEEQNRDFQ